MYVEGEKFHFTTTCRSPGLLFAELNQCDLKHWLLIHINKRREKKLKTTPHS